MKNWSDPNQKPVVRPVFFQEVDAAPRSPSPFFEGRAPSSYTTGGGAVHGEELHGDSQEFDAFADEAGGDDDGAFGGFSDGGAFDPIVPAETVAASSMPAPEPLPVEDDPRVHEALAVLAEEASKLVAARAGLLAGAEHDVVRLAVALAQRIVGAELKQRPEAILAAAREGIAVLSESERYVIRLASGPSEESVAAFRSELLAKFPRAEVIVDERLAPFTCVVENEHGRVDESIGARMASVLEQAGLTKVMAGA
jgi:Flagellar assembly protein FliH